MLNSSDPTLSAAQKQSLSYAFIIFILQKQKFLDINGSQLTARDYFLPIPQRFQIPIKGNVVRLACWREPGDKRQVRRVTLVHLYLTQLDFSTSFTFCYFVIVFMSLR